MKNTTTTTTATMNMNLFNKLGVAISHGKKAAFEEAVAYARIIDAEPADTKKLRERFGETVVTKKDAVKAVYDEADIPVPSKAQLSYMLNVGRVLIEDGTVFDGISFRAAATLASNEAFRKDTTTETAKAIREWLDSHTARTIASITAALGNTSTPSNAKVADVHNCECKDNEAGGLAIGTVSAARECLQIFFKTELAIAKESKDTARIKSVEAAWKAAMVLGVPEYAESAEKSDVVAKAIENTVKQRKNHDRAVRAAATRKLNKMELGAGIIEK